MATLRQGARGLKNLPKNLINRAASGITKLASGGKSALKWLKERIKKLFSKKRNKTGDVDGPELGTTKKPPKTGELGSLEGQKVKTEVDYPDGHKAKALEDGQCAICSNCKTIRSRYKGDIDADIDAKLTQLEKDLAKAVPGSKDAKRIMWEQKEIGKELAQKQINRIKPEIKAMDDYLANPNNRDVTRADMETHLRNKRLMEYHYKRMDPLSPEDIYLGRKEHGIKWSKNDAVQRAIKRKRPQGKWGNKADLEYAGKKAARLDPEDEFVDFPINENHQSIVHYADGSESIPDMIRIRNNGNGTFHGFPIDSKTAEPIY